MDYLLTITTSDGDTILETSVDSLTTDQVASVHAMFTEPADDDASPQANVVLTSPPCEAFTYVDQTGGPVHPGSERARAFGA